MTTPNSKIQVDSIEAYEPAGAVQISYGASIPSGGTFVVNGNYNSTGVVTSTTLAATNISSSGIVTAARFVGSSAGLTALPVINNAKSIAFTLIG
jgi:hypothetical protein